MSEKQMSFRVRMIQRGLGVLLALPLLLLLAGAGAADSTARLGAQDVLKAIVAGRGKVVLITFFATWCQPCLMEMPGLKDIRTEFSESDVMLMSLSMDEDPEMLESYLKTAGLNFPVYLTKPDVSRIFEVRGIPKLLVYNRQGRMVRNHDGYMSAEDLRQDIQALLAQ